VTALAPVAERTVQLQARRGLVIYFALLIPLSAVFEALMILGNLSWFWVLMWVPAVASVVARLVLDEGFSDVSFHVGGRRGWKAIGFALIFPIIVGLISYCIGWTTGLVHFSPQPIALAAPFIGDSTPPVLVFVINLAVAAPS
jgi:CAAX protease family protein